MDERFDSFTRTHLNDWSNVLSMKSFHEYGAKIFAKEINGDVTVARPRKKPIDEVKILLDEQGIPIWPEEDTEKPWNLETKKLVIREFMTAHYGMNILRRISLSADFHSSSGIGEAQAQMSMEEIHF